MDKEKTKIKQLVIKSYSGVVSNAFSIFPQLAAALQMPGQKAFWKPADAGYSAEELKIGLGEANLGLGCGNPHAIADLKEGETVLDLGSGAGFDAFLSCMKVGPKGYVIGLT